MMEAKVKTDFLNKNISKIGKLIKNVSAVKIIYCSFMFMLGGRKVPVTPGNLLSWPL